MPFTDLLYLIQVRRNKLIQLDSRNLSRLPNIYTMATPYGRVGINLFGFYYCETCECWPDCRSLYPQSQLTSCTQNVVWAVRESCSTWFSWRLTCDCVHYLWKHIVSYAWPMLYANNELIQVLFGKLLSLWISESADLHVLVLLVVCRN